MARVQKLSDELANQIAAGEVVERPASVVKELIENALDAGATKVTVEIEHGGTLLVRVTDDGEGMTAEDALLATERHATSKIRELADLFRLGTFGFRGEALPSIASVSRLVLRTRTRDATEGTEIEIMGGRAPVVRPAGGAIGTTIEVRELFFNVPARRKFLKATATESAHVGDVILGAALARHDVTFKLARDGRVVREYLRSTTRSERAKVTTPGETLSHAMAEHGPLRIEAMLAPPERARTGATGLSLLVNNRPVRDRVLARAVAHAYGSVLEGGRYPVGVVWLDLPHELVDVNVHPQKAEVRFTDARGIFDAITRQLHDVLAQAYGLPELGGNPYARAAIAARTAEAMRAAEAPGVALPGMTTRYEPPPPFDARPLPDTNLFSGSAVLAASLFPDLPVAEKAAGPIYASVTEGDLFARKAAYGALRFVGQMRATFLVCEGEDGIYVLDQHAAAERVTFDRLRRAYADRSLAMQRMLVPEVVELPPLEVAMLEEAADEVGRLGVEVRAVGDSAVAVHAVPALLARAQPARIIRDLAGELSRAGGRNFRGAVDLVLATMACHGSIRAGDAISVEEARALLEALDGVDFAGHCPHGRPVVMRMGWTELERRVGR